MHTVWLKGLSPEKREEVKKILLASVTMQERLLEVIMQKEIELAGKDITEEDFSDPNWSHKQAFRNGQRSILKYFKTLLEFKKD
jgi:hypothetical protein